MTDTALLDAVIPALPVVTPDADLARCATAVLRNFLGDPLTHEERTHLQRLLTLAQQCQQVRIGDDHDGEYA